jgi:hypothetical protein
MGIGSSKGIAATFGGLIAVSLFGIHATQGFERTSGIWKVLRSGHFSGAMDEEGHVRPIKGSITAQGKRYKFWEYNWVEKRPGGHGADSLLVFEQGDKGLSYLGRYPFYGSDFRGDVHPEVRGKKVLFPYHDIEILGIKQAAEISFENGPPPAGLRSEFFR